MFFSDSVLQIVQYAMPLGIQLANLIIYSSIKDAFFLVQMDSINQVLLAFNAIALAVLVLEGQIQTVSPVMLLSSFSLSIDVWLHARMDSQKILRILVISAQNILLKNANLAIRHARRAFHLRYPNIQINAYFAILLARTLMANALVEILKMSG